MSTACPTTAHSGMIAFLDFNTFAKHTGRNSMDSRYQAIAGLNGQNK